VEEHHNAPVHYSSVFSLCTYSSPPTLLSALPCSVLMSALLSQFNKARRLVALCRVCTGKHLIQPYSVNSLSLVSVLGRMQPMREEVRWYAMQSGMGREKGGQAGTLVRLILFACKRVRTNCLTEIECTLDLTVGRGLWWTVA
jgi:hypothetical protein